MSMSIMADREHQPPLMPQKSSGHDITFMPVITGHGENHKKFVFVDEHNRHKRLKVMRACEGCRRRKIKCDAATTNAWPCASCTRLKMTCIPPDKVNSADNNGDASDSSDNGGTSTTVDDQFVQGFSAHNSRPKHTRAPSQHVFGLELDNGSTPYSQADFFQPQSFPQHQYGSSTGESGGIVDFSFLQETEYKNTALSSIGSDSGIRSETHADELTGHLGDLKINHDAIAPYIANQTRNLADTPAMEEQEVILPSSVSSDMKVRIPAEMMPSDQQALRYFEYFFTNIHPYVPVLNRTYFYQQWHSNRNSISPLILEAIFACSSRMMNQDIEGNQWLALAAKHEENFKDVPRLSTIQAMLLVLKAREAVPKRGYYYRSWMTIVNLVAMAKDLKLHEHFEDHQLGHQCESNVYECAAKTRVWHTLFIVELMVGGPQGRTDFSVSLDTLDLDVPKSIPGLDEAEVQISQQFTYFVRVIRHIRLSASLIHKMRKRNPAWALDPEFVAHNITFDSWLPSLPHHLQISYPKDGSLPYIPFHYVANVHCYHYLSVIMQHRPQLEVAAKLPDAPWQDNMNICYNAAKRLCLLQEAILQNYGLPGMLCMQRGINFTIYAIMTCTLVHIIALTSPDPELNEDAAVYFPRHMRILEQCSDSWPMPELKVQIDSLRQAFSADMSRPFELKPSFPYGSPRSAHPLSPHSESDFKYSSQVASNDEAPQESLFRTMSEGASFPTHGTPLRPELSQSESYHLIDPHASQQLAQPGMSASAGQWNPGRIFDQWDTAFFTPPPSATLSQPSYPTATLSRESGSPPLGGNSFTYMTPEALSSPHASLTNVPLYGSMPNASAANPVATAPNYVTPSMWQEAVVDTYSGSNKRRWDDGLSGVQQYGVKRR